MINNLLFKFQNLWGIIQTVIWSSSLVTSPWRRRFRSHWKYIFINIWLHIPFHSMRLLLKFQLMIIPNRCTMDMTSCELFNKLTISNLCRYINDERVFLRSFLRSIEPNIRCPIRPGFYQFRNSSIDFRFFANFPLEGYRWQTSMKLYSNSKPKRELYCLSSQTSMRWVKKL